MNSSEEDAAIQIEELRIKCLKVKKLLGIHNDYKLKIDTICRKAYRKLTELSRIASYMELPKRCILMNAFLKLNLTNTLFIWMLYSHSLNNKINRLHKGYLGIIYNDKHSNFEKLLNKDNSVSIHYNNIHALAIKLHQNCQ